MEANPTAPDEHATSGLLRPAASALSGILVVLCLARFGLGAEAVLAAFFAVVLVVLAVIDLEERRIPDRIVLPATAAMLVAQLVLFPDRVLTSVVAALAVAGFLLAANLISRGGIGMGDVKLGLLLGAGLGSDVVSAVLLGSIAGGVVGLVILIRGGAEARKRAIAYGPFLALGGIVALFAGGGFNG